eukprot:TRINITY_DN10042_c0_g1_i1.p1 TRINITY_DN10042_c0_g1~~TRINITY_DN10042_c0_g1_i1.p1  ORF type:complete len:278 (-),score=54.26 TRINITY_DN10042_c0_g1_i1:80-913(-)
MPWTPSSLLPAKRFAAACLSPKWWLIDVGGHRVGRIATQIASLLQGKYKRTYNPSVICGDYVVVINARHIEFSGKKWNLKKYRWHTGYRLKEITAKELLLKKPEDVLRNAVYGMIHKNRLKFQIKKRLLVYPDDDHPHLGQKPEVYIPDKTIKDTILPNFEHSEEYTIGLERMDDGRLKIWDEINKTFSKRDWKNVRKIKSEGKLGQSLRPKQLPWDGFFVASKWEYVQQQSLVRTLKKHGNYEEPPISDPNDPNEPMMLHEDDPLGTEWDEIDFRQ